MFVNLVTMALFFLQMYAIPPQKENWQGRVSRNLSMYDIAGPYILKDTPNRDAREMIEAEIREFIWSHWRERKLGRFTATFYNVEGERSNHQVFVEPARDGRWGVLINTRRILFTRRPKRGRTIPVTSQVLYQIVERIETRTAFAAVVVIADQQQRDPRSYLLRLRDIEKKNESFW